MQQFVYDSAQSRRNIASSQILFDVCNIPRAVLRLSSSVSVRRYLKSDVTDLALARDSHTYQTSLDYS